MADKPIIFSAPMVRALLDGRKTQTRRVLKPQPYEYRSAWWITDRVGGDCELDDWVNDRCGLGPRYAPGDRLYVREAFCPRLAYPAPIAKPHYRADNDRPKWRGLWKPSIHMPREFSRLTLTVTDVRVQRLQDISEADAQAEGITAIKRSFPPFQGCLHQLRERTVYEWKGGWSVRATDAYAALWNSLHGADAWDANPWVVALTFTVQRCNIDAGAA